MAAATLIYYVLHNEYYTVQNRRDLRLRRLLIREENKIFSLDESCFIQLFRLNWTEFQYLYNIISPFLFEGIRKGSITKRLKILITLRFLSQGSYQLGVANDIHLAIGRSTISKIITEVVEVINIHFCPIMISFPLQDEIAIEISERIENATRIPGIVGIIDCTHIKIVKQAIPSYLEHIYVNRKGYHSLNVQIGHISYIIDDTYRILHINSRFSGSTHDSTIWQNSVIRNHIANKFNGKNLWIIGDSGYPLEPWLLTPFVEGRNPLFPLTSGEQLYNRYFKSFRSTVERAIGVLKIRWRCLKTERGLHYSPSKVAKMVNLCAALHNLCLMVNPEQYLDIIPIMQDEIAVDRPININQNNNLYNAGNINRLFIIATIL